ncbi:hypothetical protein NQ317_013205 [Molorchus minor]|uniref:Reverse transcriptase n=1 Tax=Molorchus minor TaxID=1323400 RepID=A0ABQ9JZZ0_9CUCU|nr:hypothetical protein NQ317_013205 [Molorchus minor]
MPEKVHEVLKSNISLDILGSEGRYLGPEPYLGITRQQVTAALNDWVYSTLKEHWRPSRGCRQARDFVTGPDPARSIWILGRSRETLNQLVGILTGHCKLRRHLSLLGIEEDPTCPRCGEDDETSYHFVGQCEAFRRLRFAIFGSGTLSREELDSLGWSDVLTFIRRLGRLSERVGRVNSLKSKVGFSFYQVIVHIKINRCAKNHLSKNVLITEIFAFKSIAYLKADPGQYLTYLTITRSILAKVRAGRCVAAGHAVGSEAATGAAKPPAGSAQPTPPASQS